jgi:hypothetical protein
MHCKHSLTLCLFLSCFLTITITNQAPTPEYVSLATARPVLAALHNLLPPELKAAGPLTPGTWDKWVRRRDREIRNRVEGGEEITLLNLLRLGVTYTDEVRITYDLLDLYGHDAHVNSIAERRADDLVRALAAPQSNEGMLEMQEFLQKKGFILSTPDGQAKTKAYLLASLARLRDDVAHEKKLQKTNSSQFFKDRGLSTDSDVYADFLIEQHLRHMIEKGLLKPGSVHRVAIVGPGLDFVNKKEGSDFYPPQTTQPFAVIDSLARLGLADPASIEVYTFDISPRVNTHIERARTNAVSGKPYTIQLLCTQWERNTPGFTNFWLQIGDHLGEQVEPIEVPEAVRGIISNRAVSVRPGVVARLTPVDMNVVFQTLPLPPEQRFDLVIGTNIFLYYGTLDQSLARANLATMIKPGGFLISNNALPGAAPSKLANSLRTVVFITPVSGDQVFSYVRVK